MLDFDGFEVLTFDCYGTLIDWERGMLTALRPVFAARGITASDEALLEAYGRQEAAVEAGHYVKYREVLRRAFLGLCAEWGVTATDQEAAAFAESLGDWPPFDDSPAALARLKRRFRLGVNTNCDEDLFARSNAQLGVVFNWVITAERAGSYKPSLHNFEVAFEAIGVPGQRILHVAQSLYHDHVPAKRLGLSTVWVNRRQGKAGPGATPPAEATPDLVVPDMRTLAALAAA